MRVLVTGAEGFLGWHVRCRLRALYPDVHVVGVGRDAIGGLPQLIDDVDAVLHLAGVNRAPDHEVMDGNLRLARLVAESVARADRPVAVAFANSIQAGNGTVYGDAKAAAGDVLRSAAVSAGAPFADVRLPNLFGEHGRPHYNSFVATFCQEVANGRLPDVADREVPLLHVQRAAAAMIDALDQPGITVLSPLGQPTLVSSVLEQLVDFRRRYGTGDIPALTSDFVVDLFNTYRATLFPTAYPLLFPKRSDARGDLVECVRSHGGQGQTFVSTTLPGVTRGEHFHLSKVERFLVLRGEAEISLRRLFSSEVVTFKVSGDEPAAVDMPTMWAHNITNTGTGELTTLFWAHEVFDPNSPDTYAHKVSAEAAEEVLVP